MKVTIMYRNNWFGGDGWTYYPVTVEIADTCPICGAKRGTPSKNRYCEDETFYYLDNWENPCGHVDNYKNCYIEAQELLKNPQKILEIALDGGVKHTRYYTCTPEAGIGCDDRFFEGTEIGGKYIRPLKQAKMWAKENGYTHLQVTRITRGKNKFFIL